MEARCHDEQLSVLVLFYPVIIFTTRGNRQRGRTLHHLYFCLIWRSVLNLLCPKRSRGASCSKDVVKLVQDELHCLVLVNHIHCHVAIVPLRAHQRRAEHDADVLGGHSVGV